TELIYSFRFHLGCRSRFLQSLCESTFLRSTDRLRYSARAYDYASVTNELVVWNLDSKETSVVEACQTVWCEFGDWSYDRTFEPTFIEIVREPSAKSLILACSFYLIP